MRLDPNWPKLAGKLVEQLSANAKFRCADEVAFRARQAAILQSAPAAQE
jgi:hypothetical protein